MKSTLTNGVGCEGWMSELPDDVLLSKLSIPGTHNSMSYTCYEANIILKIISGLSKLGKDRLAELVSQIVELKKNSELSKLGDVLPEELHPILNCTAACQSKTLTEQLQLGARFFDLRLNHELKFYHGITPLGLDVQTDAMPVLDKFLEEHPGETILLRVKSENTIEETVYRERLEEEVINKYSSRFWTWNSGYTGPGVKDEHGTVIPTLGETRGKIVLFNSYQLSKAESYIGYRLCFYEPKSDTEVFPFTCQHLQDVFQPGSQEEKIAYVKENALAADKATDPIYFINFVSSIDSFKLGKITIPIPLPQACAQLNNPEVRKMLEENIKQTAGIMVFDFLGFNEKASSYVLELNFR